VAAAAYPHLFSPGRIGSLDLRNRIVMCPMGDRLANGDGSVSDAHRAYFEARARGGAGLLLLGSVAVTYPGGAYAAEQMALAHDGQVPGYAALAERVHAHGARLAVQLVHNGSSALNDIAAGRPLLVPSLPPAVGRDRLSAMVTPDEAAAMARPWSRPGAAVRYQVATEDDLRAVVAAFAAAAERAAAAGLDGVEVHAGHGYLVDAFLSPATNARTDEWGGPVEHRTRLLCEIVRAIRARLGPTFPVWARLNGFEAHRRGGTTIDDAVATARLAVAAGLDAVHVSAAADGGVAIGVTDSHTPHRPGALLATAAVVRAAVDVPVIAVGRIEPAAAEAALAAGAVDFVAMGRALLADPELPAKLRTGRPDDVRPCIYQYRCIGNISVGRGVRCVVNPATGREHAVRAHTVSADRARRVLVAGGGPAGMEVARLLAAAGHAVELRHTGAALGGRLAVAAAVEDEMARLLAWLTRQVSGLGVVVRLGTAVTAEDCRRAGVDDVVVATGGAPSAPPSLLPPLPQSAPRSRPPATSAAGGPPSVVPVAQLTGWLREGADRGDGGDAGGGADGGAGTVGGPAVGPPVGERVLVLGGDRLALAVARRCAARGRRVTVVAAPTVFAAEMGLPGRFRTVHETEQAGVTLLGGARVLGLDAGSVRVAGTDGGPTALPADTVVAVSPTTARPALARDLAGAGSAVHVIGGCIRDGGLEGAFADAAPVAAALGTA
jgi:2,4-dienoyl-CoA reductase (NADPH2)